MTVSISYKAAQILSWFWRFNQLRMARLLSKTNSEPQLLARSFAGSSLVMDVSRSDLQRLLYLEGERICPERHLLSQLLSPGMHVVDVGANIGYYLALARRVVGDEGWVTCVEPSPENLLELKANIHRNGWKNVSLHECAVGAVEQSVGLKEGINSGVVELKDGMLETSMKMLDSLVDRKCDFLKIDVEGYEHHVLRGSESLIERDRPILFLEFHPALVGAYGGSFSSVYKYLSRYYSRIEFYDVPESESLFKKVAVRYLRRDAVRQVDVLGIPEEKMHLGRLQGTFWIVCRP